MSQTDKFKASLRAAIHTKDNPTGRYMTTSVKLFLNKLAAKLPLCYLGELDELKYEIPQEKTLLLMDYVLGQRLGKQGYFEFVPGKEIEGFPSQVFLKSVIKLDKTKHKINLTDSYKQDGEQGIINYVVLVYNQVPLFNTRNITSSTMDLPEHLKEITKESL